MVDIEDPDDEYDNMEVVLIGDYSVGKTSLVGAMCIHRFRKSPLFVVAPSYITVPYQTAYGVPNSLAPRRVNLILHDTPCHDDPDHPAGRSERRLRSYANPVPGVILICFSLTDPASLEHVRTKWYPECQKYAPEIRVLLVGLKSDAREGCATAVSEAEGRRVQKEICAEGYFEVSAKSREGVRAMCQRAAGEADLGPRQK